MPISSTVTMEESERWCKRGIVSKCFVILTVQVILITLLYNITVRKENSEHVQAVYSGESGKEMSNYRLHVQLQIVKWKNLTGSKEQLTSFIFDKNPNILDVDCEGIMQGNDAKVNYTKTKIFEERKKKMVLSDDEVSTWSRNCTEFRLNRKYITSPLSSEEMDYPIAYIINLYTSLQSFEHLLRSIYHPQNIYCIHVDQKSDPKFQERVADIARCFGNVFMATKMIEVYYAHWSIVQSNLNCMEDLVKVDINWKYVMNLCAFDSPIKTNLEIVRALKKFDGKNSVASWNFSREPHRINRYTYHYVLPQGKPHHGAMTQTSTRKDPPPHNITLFDGTFFMAFRKEAVKYLLQSKKIQDLFKWAEDTAVPDEMAWGTIQRMYPEFPGSVPPDFKYDEPFRNNSIAITHYYEWHGPCDGKRIRDICVFGARDLQRIANAPHFFLNKIGFKVDPVAAECHAELVRKKAIEAASLQ